MSRIREEVSRKEMLALTKHEKQIIVFLFFTALVGLSISYFKKVTHQPPEIIRQDINTRYLIKEAKGININTATVEQLTTLSGIGPVLAKRIVEYRSLNGPFEKKEDLMKVKGIGPERFRQIKESLVLR